MWAYSNIYKIKVGCVENDKHKDGLFHMLMLDFPLLAQSILLQRNLKKFTVSARTLVRTSTRVS